ncbi:glycosyltransferase family 2 protein, partial [Citrobacter rodentium]
MDDYLVSIIMPSFNSEHTISASISSVLQQTYTNWELLVCDDNSIDGTRSKVLEFADSRIKLLINEYAKGAAGARNTSLKYASGRFIAFLDSDDIWGANKLEMQISM